MAKISDTIKKEVKPYIKNIFTVALVSILVGKNISLANSLNIINEKVAWFFDIGVYTALIMLFLTLISALFTWIIESRFVVESFIFYDQNNKLESVKIGPSEDLKVFLYIALKGKRKSMPEKVKIFYTNELDFQIKRNDYITPNDSENSYTIQLRKLVPMQNDINFRKNIPIDVINSDADYNITIKPEIDGKKFIKHKVITKEFEFIVKGD